MVTKITNTIQDFVISIFVKVIVEIGFRWKDELEEAYIVRNTGKHKLDDGKVVVKVNLK